MEGYHFSVDLRVRFSETDAQGIANNAVYLNWFEVARVTYLGRFPGGYRGLIEQGVEALPGSLGEAVEALAGSELMSRALGEHIFPRYVELKRLEWDEYRIQVSEWEKRRYLSSL